MSQTDKIVKAMASASVVESMPNSISSREEKEKIYEAYQALQSMLENNYSSVDSDLLDVGPGSAERHALMAKQLEDSGAADDEEVQQQAQNLLDLIAKHEPEAIWASNEPEPPPHLKD